MPTRPDRLAGPGTLSWLDRLRLTAEISATHRQVRRLQRDSDDVRAVLEVLRDGPLRDAIPVAEPAAVAGRLGNAVGRAMPRLPADSRCLAQSLVLCALLARRGIEGRLIIGVEAHESFAAHAWVELEGRSLLPPGEFGRLTEL